MDIEKLYRDHGIDYVTEGHKHSRPGWVNVKCPFCTGNPGYHLGYDTIGGKFYCWRCRGKNSITAISYILRIDKSKAKDILIQYSSLKSKRMKTNEKVKLKSFKLPANEKLNKSSRQYLIKRNFDPDKIAKIWDIRSTGVYSKIGKLDYSHRILIPYYWDDQIISFDSRDVTNKRNNKYQACPKEREIIQHKKILYGKQEYFQDTGICVEGCTDVWRMGVHSFATSGITYTPAQVRVISKTFKRVVVIYDSEPQAQKQALSLIGELKFRGVDAFNILIKGDPGDLLQSEADYIVKNLIKKISISLP